MTDQIILTVPENISDIARTLAEKTAKLAEQVLLEYLETLSLLALPPDEQAELDALKHLSDDALWTIAREQMPDAVQTQATVLMDKNARGQLSDDEAAELELLVIRADRLMVWKAEAAAILRERRNSFVV